MTLRTLPIVVLVPSPGTPPEWRHAWPTGYAVAIQRERPGRVILSEGWMPLAHALVRRHHASVDGVLADLRAMNARLYR